MIKDVSTNPVIEAVKNPKYVKERYKSNKINNIKHYLSKLIIFISIYHLLSKLLKFIFYLRALTIIKVNMKQALLKARKAKKKQFFAGLSRKIQDDSDVSLTSDDEEEV